MSRKRKTQKQQSAMNKKPQPTIHKNLQVPAKNLAERPVNDNIILEGNFEVSPEIYNLVVKHSNEAKNYQNRVTYRTNKELYKETYENSDGLTFDKKYTLTYDNKLEYLKIIDGLKDVDYVSLRDTDIKGNLCLIEPMEKRSVVYSVVTSRGLKKLNKDDYIVGNCKTLHHMLYKLYGFSMKKNLDTKYFTKKINILLALEATDMNIIIKK